MSRPSAVVVSLLVSFLFLIQTSPAAQSLPSKPTGLVPQAKDSQVDLTWAAVAGNGITYNVYRSKDAGITKASGTKVIRNTTATKVAVGGLDNGTQYYFLVTAVDANGNESDGSDPVSATPTQGATAPGGQQSANSPTTNTATTNFGNASRSNVQNPTINLYGIPDDQTPKILSKSAGTLTWSDDGVAKMIANACDSKQRANQGNPPLPSFDDPSTYALINVLRLSGTGNQTVQSTNWYIYSKQKHWYRGWLTGWGVSDFDGSTRIYGAGNVILISVLLNDQNAADPSVSYKMTITKQQPSNIASVYSLLGVVFPAAAPKPGAEKKPVDYWGCSVVPIAYKTASVQTDTTLNSGGQTPFTASVTFVNEPKEWWDVSLALPVTKVNQLQYNSVANTVTPTQVNKQSLFAVFDFYIPPTNLSATSYNLIPHPFAGVAMNSQPLHSLLFGASIGLHLAEVYGGAVLEKQQSLSGLTAGSTATPAQLSSATSHKYQAKFSFGIKISVKTAISAFSSSKSK